MKDKTLYELNSFSEFSTWFKEDSNALIMVSFVHGFLFMEECYKSEKDYVIYKWFLELKNTV